MRNTNFVETADLARAAALWTGQGSTSWPHRDDAAVLREFGEKRGLELLRALQSLEADFYRSDASLTEPDLQAMTKRAADEFRARYPEVDAEVVDVLAWCHSYDHK